MIMNIRLTISGTYDSINNNKRQTARFILIKNRAMTGTSKYCDLSREKMVGENLQDQDTQPILEL
jgi:hypothetical protein